MKKLTKILVVALSLMLILGAFVIASSAAEAPKATTHVAFVVTDSANNPVTTGTGIKTESGVTGFAVWSEAVAATPAGGKITMVNNYEEGYLSATTVNINKDMTLDLNGYTFSVSFITTDAGAQSWQYNTLGSNKKFTITGNGTVKSAVAFCITSTGSTLNIAPGEDETIEFVAMTGYKYNTTSNADEAVGFSGAPFFKIAGNTATSPNCVANLSGNVNYLPTTGVGFIGVYPGGTLNVKDANIKSVLTNKDAYLFCQGGLNTSKTNFATYVGAIINIENSVISHPYGRFVDLTNAQQILSKYGVEEFKNATSMDNATKVIIKKSDINLDGNGQTLGYDFAINYNIIGYVDVSETNIVTDAYRFIGLQENGGVDVLPRTVVKFTDSNVKLVSRITNNQRFAHYGGTVIIDGGFIDMGSKSDAGLFAAGYTWIDAAEVPLCSCETSTANGKGFCSTCSKVIELPEYADPANSAKDWYVGGYGHLIKIGTAFTKHTNPGTPGKYDSAFRSFAYEGGLTPTYNVVNVDGRLLGAYKLLEETPLYNLANGHVHDFETAATGEYKDFTANCNIGSVYLVNYYDGKPRSGSITVYDTLGANNKYVTHRHYRPADPASNASYFAFTLEGAPAVSNGALNPVANPLTAYKYYSLDLDIMTPTSDVVDGVDFSFYYRSYGLNDAGNRTTLLQKAAAVTVSGSDEKITLSSVENSVTFDLPEKQWSHLTLVLSVPTDENGKADATKIREASIIVYVNGEEKGTLTNVYKDSITQNMVYSASNSTYYYNSSLADTYIDEVRINFPKTTDAKDNYNGEELAFDNVIIQRFYNEYQGTTSDIAGMHKELYETPASLPVAEFDQTYYYDMEEAFTDAFWWAEEEDATIEIFSDYKGLLDPYYYSEYFGDYTLTIITNGNKVALDPASECTIDDNGDGSITVRVATDADKSMITWLDEKGEEIKKDVLIKGSPLVSPEVEYTVVNERYYKAVYNKWVIDNGDGTYTPLEEGMTVSKDLSIKLTVGDVTPVMTDMKYNLSLNDMLMIVVYLPTDFVEDKVENVNFETIDIGTIKDRPVLSSHTINGVPYKAYCTYPGWLTFTSNTTIKVNYTVTIDGAAYPLSVSATISPLQYCDFILGTAKAKYTAQEIELVANLLRYVNEFYRAANGNYNTTINASYDKYKDLCSAYEDTLLAEKDLDYGDLGNYIKSIYVKVTGGRAQYIIEFKPGSRVTKVNMWTIGYGADAKDTYVSVGTDNSRNSYFVVSEKDLTASADAAAVIVTGGIKDESGKTATGQGAPYYFAIRNSENMRPYNFFGVLNIELTVEGMSEKVTGQYDYSVWYNGLTDEAQQSRFTDFFKAYKELADSNAAYRFKEEA